MISKIAHKFCDGDIRQIENYDKALTDSQTVWKVFHRNLLTGVGCVKPITLKTLGRYYKVKPSELVFYTKQMIRETLESNPPTKKNTWHCCSVLKWWSFLNPDKLFSEIDDEQFDLIYATVKRLHILLSQIKARCYNPTQCDYRWYGAKGIGVCDEWRNDSESFIKWALTEGYRYHKKERKGDQLSIDRIDPTKNYSPENCRWITHSENAGRARKNSGTNSRRINTRFVPLFPKAVGYNGLIDWGKAMNEYFDGDFTRLRDFLKQNDYTTMSIWRIRKNIEKRNLTK